MIDIMLEKRISKYLLDENRLNYMKTKVNKFERSAGFEFKFLEPGKFFFSLCKQVIICAYFDLKLAL